MPCMRFGEVKGLGEADVEVEVDMLSEDDVCPDVMLFIAPSCLMDWEGVVNASAKEFCQVVLAERSCFQHVFLQDAAENGEVYFDVIGGCCCGFQAAIVFEVREPGVYIVCDAG